MFRPACALALLVLSFTAPIARAQVNDAQLSASCEPSGVLLTVDMNIVDTLPADWAGWGIERTTDGVCEDDLRVTGPNPFPSGSFHDTVLDASAVSGRTYLYRIYAIDLAGNRQVLGAGNFSPAYLQTAYPSCGSAPVAEGVLVDGFQGTIFEPCDQSCWLGVSFISLLPSELTGYIGTTTRVRLYGTLTDEFEGRYITQIYFWEILGDCGPVPTDQLSWGALKQTWR